MMKRLKAIKTWWHEIRSREEVVHETEQAMLPLDKKCCPACRGTGRSQNYYLDLIMATIVSFDRDKWLYTCQECGGTGKMSERQKLVHAITDPRNSITNPLERDPW